jgi:hypothetical protein
VHVKGRDGDGYDVEVAAMPPSGWFEGALPEITAPVAWGSRRTRPFIDMDTASPLVTRAL